MKLTISLISAILASGFSFFGVSGMLSSQAPTLVRTWSAFVGLYGLSMTILLGIAWRAPSRKLSRVAAAASAGFVALWIIGSFDYAVISGLEVIAATLVAVAASINWYALHLVSGGSV